MGKHHPCAPSSAWEQKDAPRVAKGWDGPSGVLTWALGPREHPGLWEWEGKQGLAAIQDPISPTCPAVAAASPGTPSPAAWCGCCSCTSCIPGVVMGSRICFSLSQTSQAGSAPLQTIPGRICPSPSHPGPGSSSGFWKRSFWKRSSDPAAPAGPRKSLPLPG